MLQILPILFLFFTPYSQANLRFSKRRLLAVLSMFYILASVAAGVILAGMYQQHMSDVHITWFANIIFGSYLLVGTAVYFMAFQKGVRGKILFYMFVIEYALLLYILNEIGTRFIVLGEDTFSPYGYTTLFIYAVSTAVTFPLIYGFFHRFNVQEMLRINQKNLYMITGCSVVIVVITVIALQMMIGLRDLNEQIIARVYESILMVCLLIANLLSYVIYFSCMILERDKEKIESRMTAYELQYTNVRENIEKGRRMHHNLRHHFRTLGTLAAEGRTQELQDYINGYLIDLDEMEVKQVSGNPVISSVLSYYIQQSEEEHIHIKCDIQVKDNYPFDIKDMTVLIGNAMENALEASRQCEEGQASISVMMRQYKKSVLIKIENTVPPEDMAGTHMKKDKKNYGLASIEMIAGKYEGSMEAWREHGKFILRIVLNIMDAKKESGRM